MSPVSTSCDFVSKGRVYFDMFSRCVQGGDSIIDCEDGLHASPICAQTRKPLPPYETMRLFWFMDIVGAFENPSISVLTLNSLGNMRRSDF